MITITTINNSWYFLGGLVIKPNSSSTYQEENLSKNQAKDLLESVSSKRVNLSPEDLIKVQNRYNSFNSGGNVDLSGILSKIENIYKDDGVRSGVLVEEIDERIAADLDITEALSHKASLGVDGKILEEQLPNITDIPGNSATSSRLQVPVAVKLTGGVVSNQVYFDGSSDLLIEAYPILEDSGVAPGIYNASATEITPLIIDSKGRVIGTDTPVIISPEWSSINFTPNTIYGYGITDAYTKDEVDDAISNLDINSKYRNHPNNPYFHFMEHFIGTSPASTLSPYFSRVVVGGSTGAITPPAGDNRLGAIALNTGVTTTGCAALSAAYMFFFNFDNLAIGGYFETGCSFKIPILSTEVETYGLSLGFGNGTSAAPVNGAYLYYTTSGVTSRAVSNSVITSGTFSDGLTNLTAMTPYNLKIRVTKIDVSSFTAVFTINNTYVSFMTSGLPTGTGRDTSLQYIITKSAGTANRNVEIDWIYFERYDPSVTNY